jgi:hypothetical protein
MHLIQHQQAPLTAGQQPHHLRDKQQGNTHQFRLVPAAN